MKTKKLLLKTTCFLLFILPFSVSYGQSWLWGAGGYGSLKSNDYGSPVATDQAGNAYITGQYGTSVTFGSITLAGSGDNVYLTKYDATGNVIWAVQPTDSAGSSFGYSVATDKAGNIYIVGTFYDQALIFGSYRLSSQSLYLFGDDAFIAKYDPNGNVLWATQSVSPSVVTNQATVATSVTTDKYNNVYVTGYFSDTIYFGPDTLISTLSEECPFIVKYDPTGNVLWARQGVLPSNTCAGEGYSITTDNEGNVYLAGSFSEAIFWGASHLISLNTGAAFLVKYSASGTPLWARQSQNMNYLAGDGVAYSVITDEANNPYITGIFSDSVRFGSYILYSPASNYYYNQITSAFLTKYDTNGNVLWAKQSSVGMEGASLASDKVSHIYWGGETEYYFTDTIYSFGNLTLHAIPWANSSAFLLKFDTSGTAVCGSVLQNVGYSTNVGIASDSGTTSGNYVYMAGTFSDDTVTCGPDVLYSYNAYGPNIFVGRWLNCAADAGVSDIKGESVQVKVYPNPSNGIFTLIENGELKIENEKSTIEVYDMLGEKVYSQFSTLNSPLSINLSNEPNGVYLYRVLDENSNLIGGGKLVIQH